MKLLIDISLYQFFLNKIVIPYQCEFYFIFRDFVVAFGFVLSSCYNVLFFIVLSLHFI